MLTLLLRFPACLVLYLLICTLYAPGLCQIANAEPVSFRNEVMAVLSKAGCNQGTCHGNQNGKNGFRLSLRGEDPAFDLASLTRDMQGRRVNRQRPLDSLLLLKATASVPHEGGRRFSVNGPEYETLKNWIVEGTKPDPHGSPSLAHLSVSPSQQVLIEPADRVRLQVHAKFSDGTVRDVTRLAVFELSNLNVTVTPDGEVQEQQPGETTILVRYLDQRATVQLAFVPARPQFAWPAIPETSYIDHHVFAKLRSLRMLPAPICSDSVFLHRAYLDVLGVLPTADEARSFSSDSRLDKRASLVDRLLQRPEFAEFWALKWSDLLHNEEKVLDPKGVQVFHQWIRQCLAEGKPLNEFARELIAGRGSTYSNPPANYYRALRDPQTRAEATAQVFLGIRLQCARCHNHPFDRWTQNDYYSLSAFFARVDYTIVENRRKDGLDKHEFIGEQIVWQARQGEVKHPHTNVMMQPQFLGSPTPPLAAEADRLQALADWVAHPSNPFFARTQVNRIWYHLLGRGIIDPIDDARASNPPANAALLDALARDFVDHHFDLRHLVRTIMQSRVYQLSAMPNATNRADEANFSHALIRPLQAEQLLDGLAQVTGEPIRFQGYPLGTRAGQLPGAQPVQQRDLGLSEGAQFLRRFGKPERLLSCECERSEDTTVSQALQLLSGSLVQDLLTRPDNRIGLLCNQGKSNQQILEEFYLAAIGRLPTAVERQMTLKHVEQAKDRRAAWEDVVWALLNAKEFLLRQ